MYSGWVTRGGCMSGIRFDIDPMRSAGRQLQADGACVSLAVGWVATRLAMWHFWLWKHEETRQLRTVWVNQLEVFWRSCCRTGELVLVSRPVLRASGLVSNSEAFSLCPVSSWRTWNFGTLNTVIMLPFLLVCFSHMSSSLLFVFDEAKFFLFYFFTFTRPECLGLDSIL